MDQRRLRCRDQQRLRRYDRRRTVRSDIEMERRTAAERTRQFQHADSARPVRQRQRRGGAADLRVSEAGHRLLDLDRVAGDKPRDRARWDRRKQERRIRPGKLDRGTVGNAKAQRAALGERQSAGPADRRVGLIGIDLRRRGHIDQQGAAGLNRKCAVVHDAAIDQTGEIGRRAGANGHCAGRCDGGGADLQHGTRVDRYDVTAAITDQPASLHRSCR